MHYKKETKKLLVEMIKHYTIYTIAKTPRVLKAMMHNSIARHITSHKSLGTKNFFVRLVVYIKSMW